MKIIHCADLHLDSPMTSILSSEKAEIRRMELLNTFSCMLSFALENDVKAVIIAGDLFDRERVSDYAVKFVLDKIWNYPGIRFYYLRGNHDETNFDEYNGSLPENLMTFNDGWTSYRDGRNGSIVIAGSEDYSCPPELEKDAFNIVVLHGETIYESLKGRNIDYLAMGHIHSFRQEKLDARGIFCYPGCLEGRGFDECGDHGFVVIDVDDEKHKCFYNFVNIACRNIKSVSVDVTGLGDAVSLSETVSERIRGLGIPAKDMLKVELTGQIYEPFDKRLDELKNIFSNDYFAFEIKDLTTPGISYDEYENSQSLKGEFVRTVKSADDISDEDKAEIIRIGIKALRGEL